MGKAILHKICNIFAVMFSVDDSAKLPVILTGDFTDQIAESCNGHPVWSGFEDIRVADDQLGCVSLHGFFQVVHIHNPD